MRIFKIKSVKENLIWVLTIITQYSLKVEWSESDTFKLFFPPLAVIQEIFKFSQ